MHPLGDGPDRDNSKITNRKNTMETPEGNPYIHVMDDFTLVELPEFRDVLNDMGTLARYMAAMEAEKPFVAIGILCEKAPAFEELCNVLPALEVVALIQNWINASRPIVLDEDED